MILPAGWRARGGGFGLVVVEQTDPFTLPHVLLPAEQPPAATRSGPITGVITGEQLLGLMNTQFTLRPAEKVVAAPTAAEIRARKEHEAAHTPEPYEWATHVYVAIDGQVRWRCCANLFSEDHSPYCQAIGDRA